MGGVTSKSCKEKSEESHHCVCFDAIDEDGDGSHTLLFHVAYQLPNVHLLRNDMLTVQ